MAPVKYHLHDGKKGAALAIRVTPRSSRNEIVEVLNDGTVKIRLTSSPSDARANQELIDFLAGILDIAPSRIEVVAGTTGHDKLVSILDMDAATVQQRIIQNL